MWKVLGKNIHCLDMEVERETFIPHGKDQEEQDDGAEVSAVGEQNRNTCPFSCPLGPSSPSLACQALDSSPLGPYRL